MKRQHVVFFGRIPAWERIVKVLRNMTPSEVNVVGGDGDWSRLVVIDPIDGYKAVLTPFTPSSAQYSRARQLLSELASQAKGDDPANLSLLKTACDEASVIISLVTEWQKHPVCGIEESVGEIAEEIDGLRLIDGAFNKTFREIISKVSRKQQPLLDELFSLLTPGNVDWKPKRKKDSEYGPRESVTIIGKVASYQGVENCIRAFTPGAVEVIGPEDAWREIILRYPNGTKVTFCSLVPFKDGDHCARISVGLYQVAGRASSNDQELKDRIADQCLNAGFVIGVVASPAFDQAPRVESAILEIAAEIEGLVYNGSEFIDPEGNVLLEIPDADPDNNWPTRG